MAGRIIGGVCAAIAMMFSAHAQAAGTGMKIVTFGTSLTEQGGWQPLLKSELEKCIPGPVKVDIIARSGSTSDWAVASVERVVKAAPDVVLVEFYANDAALDRFFSISRSRANMRTVMDRLRSGLPHARIVGMVMNPMFGIRGWGRPFIGSYIAAHRAIAASRGVETIDHTPAWSRLSAGELEAAIPDGVHPIPAIASQVMVPTLVKALAPDCRP